MRLTLKMAAPIPVVLCGQSRSIAATVIKSLKPEYEVVHGFTSVSAVKEELPAVMQGKGPKPSSGIGSNVENAGSHAVPRAVLVGAAYSKTDLAEMRALPGSSTVPWLYPAAGTGWPGPAGRDFAEWVCERLKGKLQEKGVAPGMKGTVGATEVWEY